MDKKMKFEDALKRLEEIVSKLEEGEESLEESLKLFEEGIKLAKLCSHRLEEAEKKVKILKRDEAGQLKQEPFQLKEEKTDFNNETQPDTGNNSSKEVSQDGRDNQLLF